MQPPPAPALSLRLRRTLAGASGKIVACAWTADGISLACASQGGAIGIWAARPGLRRAALALPSCFVLALAWQGGERLIAAGGLDSACSVFASPAPGPALVRTKPLAVLAHAGYISSIAFRADDVLTASGDATVAAWSLAGGGARRSATYAGHLGDCLCVAAPAAGGALLASGGCDATLRVWDARARAPCVLTLRGHASDVNAVAWHPGGCGALASGGDDAEARVWDCRAPRAALAILRADGVAAGVTAVAWSASGRLVIAGYDDEVGGRAFDLAAAADGGGGGGDGGGGAPFAELRAHASRVACAAVNTQGDALAFGSWDGACSIWA